MHKNKRHKITRIVALALIAILICPIFVNASTGDITPRASNYLDYYNTYIYNAAFGKIQVYFDVTGVDYMDDIGVLSIQIYESSDSSNWTRVKTYTHDATTGMLSSGKVYYSSHVDYAGTIGRYYKAYVCIWAGKDGDGDTRYMWTQPQKATLFAG